MSHAFLVLALLWFCILPVSARSDEVVLAEHGTAMFQIILPENPPQPIQEAAQELVGYLKGISGAAFTSGKGATGLKPFYLGDCETTRKLGIDATRLKPEGFQILVQPEFCAIVGRIPSDQDILKIVDKEQVGVWHGVHRFLEDLGVRWLWPGELGEVVPRRPHLVVSARSIIDAPRLARRGVRNYIGDATTEGTLKVEGEVWLRRLGLGGHLNVSKGHAFESWREKYGQAHPEVFAMGGQDLCISNPQTLALVIEDKVKVRPVRSYDSVSIAPNDVSRFCECSGCKALDVPGRMMKADYGSLTNTEDPVMTDRYVHFWNQVAEASEKTHPHLRFSTYAYMRMMPPPVREKLHPNIDIWSVLFWDYTIRGPVEQERYRQWWRGWNEAGAHEMLLRPNFLHFSAGLPIICSRRFAADFQFCYGHGMVGTDFDALEGHFAARAPMLYLIAKLQWDPAQSIENILNDFYRQGFGPAAEPIRKYFELCEQVSDRIARQGFLDHCFFYAVLSDFFDERFIAQANTLLNQAKAAAKNNARYRKRVDFIELGLTYATFQSRVNRFVRKETLTVEDRKQFFSLVEARKAFLEGLRNRHALNFTWIEGCTAGANANEYFGLNLYEDLKSPRTVAPLGAGWKIRFDPKGQGEAQRWYGAQADLSAWRPIKVGIPWEAQGYAGYNGAAWYRLSLNVPKELQGRRLALKFNAVDDAADVWLNSTKMGHYAGHRKMPFEFEITAAARYGQTNELAVKVIDTGAFGGLWKRVWLVSVK